MKPNLKHSGDLRPFGYEMHVSPGTPLSDLDIHNCEQHLAQNALLLIRGTKAPTETEFLQFCTSLPSFSSQPLEWDFGPVMNLKVRPKTENYLFSDEKVPFHWDGAFFKEPALLAFHCIEAPAPDAGGETIFAHTPYIWQNLPTDVQEICSNMELEYTTAKKAHYGGTRRVKLVQQHPRSQATILRFAEPVQTELNPVTLKTFGVSASDASYALNALTTRAYSDAFRFTHKWQAGDILLADNFSLIHGRNAFRKDTKRWMQRIQIMPQ